MEVPLKSSGEKGIFNKYDWVKEADNKFISAKLLRECAVQKKLELDNLRLSKQSLGEKVTSKETFEIVNSRNAANKSSVLILGYAIELLLKSGIVSLLIHAPKKLLEKRVRAYSHDLLAIALDLHISLSPEEASLLKTLSSYIIQETRYPVTPESVNDYHEKVNAITAFISNEEQFSLGLDFYSKLKNLIQGIDGTTESIKFHTRMNMEENGYLIFRIGGGLPPIFIINYCQTQIDKGENTLGVIHNLLLEYNKTKKTIHTKLMEESWEIASFYKVDRKKGLTKQSTRC